MDTPASLVSVLGCKRISHRKRGPKRTIHCMLFELNVNPGVLPQGYCAAAFILIVGFFVAIYPFSANSAWHSFLEERF